MWGAGGWLTWASGLVLMLSPFMGWYVGSDAGPTIAVTGWHTGVLWQARLRARCGCVVLLQVLHEFGIDLP